MSTKPKTFSRPKQAAERLGISLPTLYRYARTIPAFPKVRKLGPRVAVFDDEELDAYAANSKVAA